MMLFSAQLGSKSVFASFSRYNAEAHHLGRSPSSVVCAVASGRCRGPTRGKVDDQLLESKMHGTAVDTSSMRARGVERIEAMYGPLLPTIVKSWGAHAQDMRFNAMLEVYGLYLSDFEVMTPLETEAVVFATVCCTGLRSPNLWHTRGMGRLLGARGTDDETVEMRKIKDMLRALKIAFMTVAEFVGDEFVRRVNLEKWVNVGDVVKDLGGWGDDEQK